jgi:hypothetical protein
MPDDPRYLSPEQFAANRANAAKSTGPRSPEGKARSSQNARKHGFASAAYTVVRLEDIEEVANLKHDAVEFYQPITSQELYAVERIAITQQAMLRAARLEAGLFTSCLNDVLDMRERPLMMMDPDMSADTEAGHEQTRNFLLAEGFKRLVAKSPAMSLCLRYSAQAERHYRRALEEFNRLKSLRPSALPTPVAQSNPHPPAHSPKDPPIEAPIEPAAPAPAPNIAGETRNPPCLLHKAES